MKIIGVAHLESYLPQLIDFLERTETPKSVMLEIPPGEAKSEVPQGYFEGLESYFADKSEVVHGDKYLWCVLPWVKSISDRVSKLKDGKSQISLPSWFLLGGEILASFPYTYLTALNPINILRRDIGFIETAEKYRPSMAITGFVHAAALKRAFPDAELTAFMVHSPLHYACLPVYLGVAALNGVKIDKFEIVNYKKQIKIN